MYLNRQPGALEFNDGMYAMYFLSTETGTEFKYIK